MVECKCNRAKELIMKYMDGEMKEIEAHELNSHTSNCADCMATFRLYDEIIQGFDFADEIEVPNDFEDSVMLKIAGIMPKYRQNFSLNLGCLLLGLCSVLGGLSTILIINRDEIEIYLINTGGLERYTKNFEYVYRYVDALNNSFISIISSIQLIITSYMPLMQTLAVVVVTMVFGTEMWKKRSRVES